LINVSNLEVEHTNVSQEKGEMLISSWWVLVNGFFLF
jgi:hypothetical protein